MPENFGYSADFTDERGCPVKPGMTRKERRDDEERARMTAGRVARGG